VLAQMGFGKSNRRASPAAAPARPAMAMPPPRAPPAAAAPPAQSAGPGLMGTLGSSMAGSMAGSMIGNAMFSGRSGGEQAPAQVAAPAGGMAPAAPLCQFETQQFLQCMTNTYEDMSQCRQFYDAFKQCNVQA